MKIIIAGAGDVGVHLAKLLADESHDIYLIDKNEERLKSISAQIDVFTIPDIKNRGKLTESLQKQKEGELTLDRVKENDYLVLLDETGRQMDSLLFSNFINTRRMGSHKRLIFLIGGPYGFSDSVYVSLKPTINI